MVRVAVVLLLLMALPSAVLAEKRVALVIGNSAYKHAGELANPKNDADDIAAALKALGIEVIKGLDLDKRGMDSTVLQFSKALSGADVGIFFYSGHGLQVNGNNYLVPVDAELSTAAALDFEMVRLDLVQRIMEYEVKTNILFLDACRNNPLTRNLARALGTRAPSIGKGLAAAESGVGTLISFSTQPGNVALDGTGRNSPYTGPLVKRIGRPGEDVLTVLTDVRNEVLAATGEKQVPWENHALRARFYFGAPPSYEQQAEVAVWLTVKDTTDPLLLQSFLSNFPSGRFAGAARVLLEKLHREAELRRAEEVRNEAELVKIESERKAEVARQADELKAAREEVRRSKEALAKAEREREAAKKAAEAASTAAEKANAGREPQPAIPARKNAGNCFYFNNRTFCQ